MAMSTENLRELRLKELNKELAQANRQLFTAQIEVERYSDKVRNLEYQKEQWTETKIESVMTAQEDEEPTFLPTLQEILTGKVQVPPEYDDITLASLWSPTLREIRPPQGLLRVISESGLKGYAKWSELIKACQKGELHKGIKKTRKDGKYMWYYAGSNIVRYYWLHEVYVKLGRKETGNA